MIKAVIFDMDGTLFDTERVYRDAWRAAGADFGIADIERVIRDCTGRNPKDTKAYFDRELAGVIRYEDFYPVRDVYYNATIDAHGVPVKPGVPALLAYLKSRGIKIALGTSTMPERTMFNLRSTGILPYFEPEAIITGDLVTRGKPDPETFMLAAERLGLTPAECMGVEDSFNGVRALSAAGMVAVMVPDTIEPTEEIRSMLYAECREISEVRDLVDRINEER